MMATKVRTDHMKGTAVKKQRIDKRIMAPVKVKIKLFLCYFLTERRAMKAYWGVGA
jgi:hypothetical protein